MIRGILSRPGIVYSNNRTHNFFKMHQFSSYKFIKYVPFTVIHHVYPRNSKLINPPVYSKPCYIGKHTKLRKILYTKNRLFFKKSNYLGDRLLHIKFAKYKRYIKYRRDVYRKRSDNQKYVILQGPLTYKQFLLFYNSVLNYKIISI